VAAHVKSAPRYAVVFTTLGVTHPTYDLPEATPGYTREATLTPGTYTGVLYVVDRVGGKVACAAPLLFRSRGGSFHEKTQDLARVVEERFQGEIVDARRDALRAMAPGLTEAL
jgi:hypothetical protein